MPNVDKSTLPDVASLKPERPKVALRDWPFALLFLVNIGAIAYCTVSWGLDMVAIQDDGDASDDSATPRTWFTPRDMRHMLLLTCGFSFLAVGVSLLYIKLITAFTRGVIYTTLWLTLICALVMSGFGFYTMSWFLGVMGLVIAVMAFWALRGGLRHRIPFAVANLKVASKAISKHWSAHIVAIAFTLVQVVWVLMWCLGYLGLINHLGLGAEAEPEDPTLLSAGMPCSYGMECASMVCQYIDYTWTSAVCAESEEEISISTYVVNVIMVLSLYWGLQVGRNIAHTTIAGTVASFWHSSESAGSTGASLKRTLTTSFGSVCFGSLIVAMLDVLSQLAAQTSEEEEGEEGEDDSGGNNNNNANPIGCIITFIYEQFADLVEYLNRWAFVYVGIYGYKFTTAGKAVAELFEKRGFDVIVNDNLIGNVLVFASLAVGLLCAGLGVAIAHYTDFVMVQHSAIYLAVLGLFVGWGVAITPLSVIDSSVQTIAVCFAEDPEAFQESHPELYDPLVTAWHARYPNTMVNAGYWNA